MRVLVTGGAGFVGSHIVALLQKEGHKPESLDDMSAGVDFLRCGNIKARLENLAPSDLRDFEAIVHCAASADIRHNWDGKSRREEIWASNLWGLIALLEVAPKSIPFVFLSSGACFEHPRVTSPYTASKIAGEALVQAYRPDAYILRPAAMVGRNYHHGHVADFVAMAREFGKIVALTNGRVERSYVHVDDVADFVSVCLAGSPKPGTYGLSSADFWSPRHTASVIQQAKGPGIEIEWGESDTGWQGDVAPRVPRRDAIRAGWQPTREIASGIRDMIERVWP
jgi:nucleoside-diphosphate-sugar epimerase